MLGGWLSIAIGWVEIIEYKNEDILKFMKYVKLNFPSPQESPD